MKELIEDYHDQNPHLDLPQLLWPDFSFDTGIYDPMPWTNSERFTDAAGNQAQWIITVATRLAPELSHNQPEVHRDSNVTLMPSDQASDSCKRRRRSLS